MNWCEHITLEYRPEGCFWSFLVNKRNYSVDDFMMCPICGAKRPERKGLEEKLEETWCGWRKSSSLNICKSLSNTAIDHACEVIDSWLPSIAFPTSDLEKLKQALRESI